MKKLFLLAALALFAVTLTAQDNARWLRYPAISPDGQTIVFGYGGNLYRIAANGGVAIPITTSDAHDMRPVWSHDGKTLAFASDRYGNFDVYTMPAMGGTPTRITYNSANDYPFDFTIDNAKVLFGSGREALAQSVRFPSLAVLWTMRIARSRQGISLLKLMARLSKRMKIGTSI